MNGVEFDKLSCEDGFAFEWKFGFGVGGSIVLGVFCVTDEREVSFVNVFDVVGTITPERGKYGKFGIEVV